MDIKERQNTAIKGLFRMKWNLILRGHPTIIGCVPTDTVSKQFACKPCMTGTGGLSPLSNFSPLSPLPMPTTLKKLTPVPQKGIPQLFISIEF